MESPGIGSQWDEYTRLQLLLQQYDVDTRDFYSDCEYIEPDYCE